MPGEGGGEGEGGVEAREGRGRIPGTGTMNSYNPINSIICQV